MKRLLLVVFLFVQTFALAQNYTAVSGSNIVDATGAKLPSGSICWAPVTNAGVPISYSPGGGGQASKQPVCVPVAAGAFALTLPNVSLTNPANICFKVIAYDANGKTVLGQGAPTYTQYASGYECVQPTGATFNFDAYVPNLATGPSLLGPYTTGNLAVIGNLSVTGSVPAPTGDLLFSTPTIVNVLSNKYGVALAANGITDNCSAWAALQAAVPAGSILAFPKGSYYLSPGCNASGFVLTKRLSVYGESPGWFDGTTIHDATLFLAPITMNSIAGVTVANIATDCRSWGAACDGISSGAAVTTAGHARVENYLYVGTGAVNPSHGVLIQSGPDNVVRHLTVYSAFHAAAIRSPDSTLDDVHAHDSFDVVVKSATGSGTVYNVHVSNIYCDGSNGTTKNGCQLAITSQNAGVSTYNVTIDNVVFNSAAYGLVFIVDNGGSLFSVSATNVNGFNMTTPLYAFTNGGGGTCNNITVEASNFTSATTANFLNSLGCTAVTMGSTRINGGYAISSRTFDNVVGINFWALPPNGTEGFRVVPATDGDGATPSIGGTNAANNTFNWLINKAGQAAFNAGIKAGVAGTAIADTGTLAQFPATLSTAAATTDVVSITGVTSASKCSLLPTNASAATNLATTYVSAKTTNQITVTHTATAGMTYDIMCTAK